MSSVELSLEPKYTRGEEIANTLSAAAGLVLFLGISPFLMAAASGSERPLALGSTVVFLASMLGLYLSSMLYHALAPCPMKRIVRILDHSAIFVLIAGTYTPFALGPLAASGGFVLAIIEWTMAVLGIAFKWARRHSIQALVKPDLLVHGLAGNFVDPTVYRECWLVRILFGAFGGNRLHCRDHLLRRETSQLRASRLASVRHRRLSLPYHRHLEVCNLGGRR